MKDLSAIAECDADRLLMVSLVRRQGKMQGRGLSWKDKGLGANQLLRKSLRMMVWIEMDGRCDIGGRLLID